MSYRLAYDGTRPELIPAHAEGIMYYADGDFAWTKEDLARFPKARRRAITVLNNPHANIADVEKGNMVPSDCPGFLAAWRHEHARGLPGTIYCSRDTLAEVQAVCHGLEYSVWLATLDGTIPTSIKGGGTLVAVQYEGGLTAEYDVSALLNDTWLHPA